jgi:ATP-binding protein involved in chromosome partitioning
MVTEESVITALRSVNDPEVFKDLVTLNRVKRVKVFESSVSVDVEVTTKAVPLIEKMRYDVTAAIKNIPGVEDVIVNFGTRVAAPAAAGPAGEKKRTILTGVADIIAVGAGKGGVGKSTVAVNMAVGLARQGARVGLLDGDIYGPSIPTMTGIGPRAPELDQQQRIIPFLVGPKENPIRVMSIGFMVDPEKALIWRGPMAHGAIKQFLEQVDWGDLDYLVVDLPPGTGDVSLTLAQLVPLTGAVIVATPQEVALADARRAVRMFQQLGVEILGVVENMSYFICEHGSEYDLFGRGGAQTMAQTMGLPFLGAIPIDMQLRINSDKGDPYGNFNGRAASSEPLAAIVELLRGRISLRNATRPAGKPMTLRVD